MVKKSARKMTKKSARKATARKLSGPTAARKPGKAATGKPRRAGRSEVSFGLHGMTEIMKKVQDAGLQSEFDQALGHKDKFVKVRRNSLIKMKEFLVSKPELADFAEEMGRCNCPPNDPYCIYI